MATRIQAAVMKTKSGMTTQIRGLPCLSNSGHGKPRLSYNGHMPKPLSHHFGKSFPLPRPACVRIMPSKPSFPAHAGPLGPALSFARSRGQIVTPYLRETVSQVVELSWLHRGV